MQITGKNNAQLKEVRRAIASGRPTEDGLVVAEGPHLLAEAVDSHWTVERVLVHPSARGRFASLLDGRSIVEIEERLLESIAATETTQGVLTLLRPKEWLWSDLAHDAGLTVILDGIQDPGNAGTIVRSAEAFGATGVIFLRGSVHAANGKFLRATAGSIFRLPFLTNVTVPEILGWGLRLYALDSRATMPLSAADLKPACGLITGSEGSGVSPDLLRAAEAIRISTRQVESLNAGVACSIALYEAQRQRSRI